MNTTKLFKNNVLNMQPWIFGCILLFASFQGKSQCPPGDIILTSQTEIDNFSTNFPGCASVEGDLIITGSDIVNLLGLSQIDVVEGSLDIDNCGGLGDLSGLDNLAFVGLHVWIKNNPKLVSLQGFGIQDLGWWLDISNNPVLESIDGLSSMTSFGLGIFPDGAAINIRDNESLLNLKGLEGVVDITEHLWIHNNASLESLAGLDNVKTLNSYLEISENPSLVDIFSLSGIDASTIFNTDFPNIVELEIVNNVSLSDCAIQSVCDFLDITDPDYNASIFGNTGDCIDLPAVELACGGGECTHPDFEALMALFDSTNGFNWFNSTGWIDGALGTDCDPCSWYGVTCDANNRVTCLDLDGADGCNSAGITQGNNLDGILTDDIHQLTELQELHLEGNSLLEGELPAGFYELFNLEVTTLHLTGLEGQFEPAIANLSNLMSITAGFNNMGGPIPAEFGELTNLTNMNLFFADFSGEIPWQLANLTNLTELRLNDNNLTGCFPPQLETLCGIGTITFANNAGLPGGGDFASFCATGTGSCLECYPTLEGPIVDGITTEDYSTGAGDWTRFNLPVVNWDIYPQELFDPAPQLAPCGINTNASRSWVSIYNGDTDTYIYGFCALGDPASLENIWFAIPQSDCPPETVFVEIHDRACNIFYYSDLIEMPVCCPTFDSNDADSGWGIWNDGGADAGRSNLSAYAYSQPFSFMIKDNTPSSVIYTDDMDHEFTDALSVDFTYKPRGFNNENQDFWLQISTDGGNNYETIAEWAYLEDFENEERYFENVLIPGPFTANTRIQFRCDATGNNDKIYIDDIVIKACEGEEPTCDDGIQNGDETGVDCGGVDCPECPPCMVEDANDFEANWGIWNDGGADANRSNLMAYANSGTFSLMIKDNTSTSVITTDNMDLSDATEVVIDFNFITREFNTVNHDFWLQVSTDGGATFTTVQEWVYTVDFFNEVRVFENAFIPGPFTTTTQFRFRCDAAGNNDKVYIDDIIIEACEFLSIDSEIETSNRAVSNGLDFTVYPNPISQGADIQIDIQSRSESVELVLLDLFGTIVSQRQVKATEYEAASFESMDLNPGTYFMFINDGQDRKVKQFIVVE